jgi:hypothetical protein
MRITVSQLRRIIKEEVSRVVLSEAAVDVEKKTISPEDYEIVKDDIKSWAEGEPDDSAAYFYPGWTSEDFQAVVDEYEGPEVSDDNLGDEHTADCNYEPDDTFVCDTCDREVCYCQGGADDMPNTCSDCWAKAR